MTMLELALSCDAIGTYNKMLRYAGKALDRYLETGIQGFYNMYENDMRTVYDAEEYMKRNNIPF